MVLKEGGKAISWGCRYIYAIREVMAISAGGKYNIELKEDGTVIEQREQNDNFAVPSLKEIKAIDIGWKYSVALGENGMVNFIPTSYIPGYINELSQVTQVTGVKAVSAGYSHILALKEDGTIVACGNNVCGQCTIPSQKAK